MSKPKATTFLSHFHQSFEEARFSFADSEANNASAQSRVANKYAPHIDTIHLVMHVLTGGPLEMQFLDGKSELPKPAGIVRPNITTHDDVLFYFNLFKGLSDGVLSANDFADFSQHGEIKMVKLLLDGNEEYVRKFAARKSVEIGQEDGAFEAYRQHVSATSKSYVKHVFDWMNKHVVAGDIDATNYVKKISEAERVNEADRTLIQKIYSNSNTKILLENRGLEGASSDKGERGEEAPSGILSSTSAAKVDVQQHQK